jgi:hypothetical protein
MPAGFFVLIAVMGVFCIFSIGASVSAIVCSVRYRFFPAVILSLIGMAIAYFGLTHLIFNSSKTVNDEVVWKFDSKWLFTAALAFGALVLAYAIWRKMKFARELRAGSI